MVERVIERDRAVALALGNGQQRRHRARRGMGMDGLALENGEAFGAQRLQSNVIGAAGDCAFDPRREKLLETREQDVLQIDGER